MESVGFKEWSLVCDALGRGEQSVILRKGGIAEGQGGFSFRHREFFLFPTFFHEQVGAVRTIGQREERLILTFSHREKEPDLVYRRDEMIEAPIVISVFATVERAVRIESLKIAEALAPLHILEPEVVRERFGYRGEGLSVAFVRVFRLEEPWTLANEKRFGGCRSWVELPQAPAEMSMLPVLDDAAHAQRRADLQKLISSS